MTNALTTLLLLLLAQPQEPPLPTLRAMNKDIGQIINTLMTVGESMQDRTQPSEALQGIAYTETETLISLDGKGNPKETVTNVYHVSQGIQPWQFYRKQISKNGVPQTTLELEKQDLEQQKREQKQSEEMERAGAKYLKNHTAQGPGPVRTPEQQKQFQEYLDTMFVRRYSEPYDIQIVRREVIDGHNAVLMTFRPKANTKPKDGFLKMLQHISIDAWVAEQEHQVVKMNVSVVDTISFGLGLLAKFNKGSSLSIERRIVNEGVWAPVKAEGLLSARILLVKGLNKRIISRYSDFKKYTVDATLKSVQETP